MRDSRPTPLNESVTELLAALGIPDGDTYDATVKAINVVLDAQGIRATVTSIRWGCATIEADNVNASRATWHTDRLRETVRKASRDLVQDIRVRVRRDEPRHQDRSL